MQASVMTTTSHHYFDIKPSWIQHKDDADRHDSRIRVNFFNLQQHLAPPGSSSTTRSINSSVSSPAEKHATSSTSTSTSRTTPDSQDEDLEMHVMEEEEYAKDGEGSARKEVPNGTERRKPKGVGKVKDGVNGYGIQAGRQSSDHDGLSGRKLTTTSGKGPKRKRESTDEGDTTIERPIKRVQSSVNADLLAPLPIKYLQPPLDSKDSYIILLRHQMIISLRSNQSDQREDGERLAENYPYESPQYKNFISELKSRSSKDFHDGEVPLRNVRMDTRSIRPSLILDEPPILYSWDADPKKQKGGPILFDFGLQLSALATEQGSGDDEEHRSVLSRRLIDTCIDFARPSSSTAYKANSAGFDTEKTSIRINPVKVSLRLATNEGQVNVRDGAADGRTLPFQILLTFEISIRNGSFSSLPVHSELEKHRNDLLTHLLVPQPTRDLAEAQQEATVPLFYDHLEPSPSFYPSAAMSDGVQAPHLIPEGLEPTLLPFQSRTVNWMLRREGKKAIAVRDGEVKIVDLDDEEEVKRRRGVFWEKRALRRTFGDSSRGVGQGKPVEVWKSRLLENVIFWEDPAGSSPVRGLEKNRDDSMAVDVEKEDVDETERLGARPDEWGGNGMVCEEMGMGKTLEVISLILLSLFGWTKMPDPNPGRAGLPRYQDEDLQTEVKPTGLTLIVCPASILSQWKSEIERHSPSLRVFVYTTISKIKEDQTPEYFAENFDVVLTSYSDLRREVNSARKPPERNFRQKKGRQDRGKYRRSLLVQVNWYRVVMDEAQMVDNGDGTVSEIVSLLPRCHSFAVSGTPVRQRIEDLQGIFLFLKIDVVGKSSKYMKALLSGDHAVLFRDLVREIGRRTTKAQVGSELAIPKQHRFVVPVDLSAVELYHYNGRYQDALTELGLNEDGKPPSMKWRPDPIVMRKWLLILRQACFHATVGEHNRRILGAALKTVDEVLDAMIDQNTTSLLLDKRAYYNSFAKRAQLLMYDKEECERFEQALRLLEIGRDGLEHLLTELKEDLELVKAERKKERGMRESTVESVENDVNDQQKEGSAKEQALLAKQQSLTGRIQDVVISLHSTFFFEGSARFMMGKFPDEERRAYDQADALRTDALAGQEKRTLQAIKDLEKRLATRDSPKLVPFPRLNMRGGLLSADVFDRSDETIDKLNETSEILGQWRTSLLDVIRKPLGKEQEEEVTGEEYESGAANQEVIDVYIELYSAILNDWRETLTGERFALDLAMSAVAQQVTRNIEEMGVEGTSKVSNAGRLQRMRKMDRAEALATIAENQDATAGTRLYAKMQLQRDGIVAQKVSSARQLMRELRDAKGRTNRLEEGAICDKAATLLKQRLNERDKVLDLLTAELTDIRQVYAERVLYFKQLQIFSDEVQDIDVHDKKFKGVLIALEQLQEEEDKLARNIATKSSKKKYLAGLQTETSQARDTAEGSVCTICDEHFKDGMLTKCAHLFCKTCFSAWMGRERSCPLCKTVLGPGAYTKVTIEKAFSESANVQTIESSAEERFALPRIDPVLLNEVEAIPLGGPSRGHVRFIRRQDPNGKVIVFSAWTQALDLLRLAFDRQGITHIRVEGTGSSKGTAAVKFAQDPSIVVFMLHTRSQSAGLNLTGASTVILVEPLLHPALELQAVGRTHRIGQTKETQVFQYYVSDSVDQRVAELAARKHRSLFTEVGISDQAKKESEEIVKDMASSARISSGKAGSDDYVEDEDELATTLFEKKQLGYLQQCMMAGFLPEGEGDEMQRMQEQSEREIMRNRAAAAAERRVVQAGPSRLPG